VSRCFRNRDLGLAQLGERMLEADPEFGLTRRVAAPALEDESMRDELAESRFIDEMWEGLERADRTIRKRRRRGGREHG